MKPTGRSVVLSVHFSAVMKPLILGMVLGAFAMGLLVSLQSIAASDTIVPNAAGNTSNGTPTGSCSAAANYTCVDEGSSPDTGDSVVFGRNDFDSYQWANTITGVDTATTVVVYVYHAEQKNNMQLEVELWNAAESAQIGSSVVLPYTATAQWDTASFTGLSLNQAALDGLRVRTTCLRTSGGGPDTCTSYSVYAVVGYTEIIDITVSATGNQQDLDIDTTNQHVGGAFVFTDTGGNSPNITSVTITETGTVDAQNDISNVRLYYENDVSSPFNCAAESFDGNEAQYGATSTSFNAANGTATFTDTGIGISTISTLCMYAVVDVDDTASFGETLEIEITDPSTQVVGSGSAVVTPNTAIALADTSTLLEPIPTLTQYHWRLDNGDQTDNAILGADSAVGGATSTSLDAADKNTNYRLRLAVSNEGNATTTGIQYQLEFGSKMSTCDAITEDEWIHVASSTDDWDMFNSTFITDGNTTNITDFSKGALNDDNTDFVGTGALRETTDTSASIVLDPDEFTELEYSLNPAGTITDGTTYCFRVTDSGAVLPGYDVYPEITFQADVSVATEEAQVSTIDIPTNNNVLGAFLITDAAGGGHDIDEITITASSTVSDVTTAFADIQLYYETDIIAPYDCAADSYSGVGETLYGNQTIGSFSSNATATFSAAPLFTPTVTPTQAVCLYVVLDVTASSSNGDTLDIQIADPSSEVILDAGTVAPASTVDLTGFTTLVAPYVNQAHYHWRNNDGTEVATSSGGATSATDEAEDTVLVDMRKSTPYRVRFAIENSGGTTTAASQYRLEWAQKITECSAATGWTDVGATADEFDMFGASNLVEGNNTTNINIGSGGVTDPQATFVGTGGQRESSSQTGNVTLDMAEFYEVEYAIQASSSVLSGVTYCFRLTDAGSELDQYETYAEAIIRLDTDYFIQRGTAEITGTTVTITAGVDYVAPVSASNAFIRITNSHNTGAGPLAGTAGNNNADAMTAYISNPGNIGTSITFSRFSGTSDTMIAWEIIEYTGSSGGDNEMIVRSASTATYGTAATAVTTGTVSGISDDNDVVVFVTGQGNPDGGRQDYESTQSTSAWNSGADNATFTRGHSGGDAVVVSYAVVEFTGSNWLIQRAEHTYVDVGVAETETITTVGSLSRAFVHGQHRTGSGLDQHGDFGHETWLSGSNQVSFRINGAAQAPGSHTSVAWVIENTQSVGAQMDVTRSSGAVADGGGGLTTTNVNIGKTLDDLTISSLFLTSSNNDTGRSFPESFIRARLISDTQYELRISDDSGENLYRAAVVEWPTAARKLNQNYYQFYENNDLITPTTPWPCEVGPCGENAPITGLDNPPAAGDVIRLRISTQVSGANMLGDADTLQLQWAEQNGTCAASTWQYLGDIGSTTALWRGTSTPVADGATLPSTILSVSDVAGTFEEETPTALLPNSAIVGEDVEMDWVLEHNGATEKTNYCFRLVENDGSILESYIRYPVIATAGYGAQSQNWRWYDDAENETPSTALAAENTAPVDIDFDNSIQLRLTLREVSGVDGQNIKYRLEFSESSSFASSTWVDDIGNCIDGASLWCYVDEGGVDNATITTATLSDTDSCTSSSGPGCGMFNESGTSSTTSDHVHQAGDASEFAFNIRQAGARANVTYFFRVYDDVNQEYVSLGSGESYPSVSTAGASMVFTMSGVGSGQVTEGVTTDVATTPAEINFGSVPIDVEYEAAHRLAVDTNGTEGYQVFVYAPTPLQSTLGTEIKHVSASNTAPASWSTVCETTEKGCFGYHAGDDTLAGGTGVSDRFLADDRYAALEVAPREIAYSTNPTVGDTIDMIYKLQITQLQEAAEYETQLVYLAIPVF